MSSWTSRILKTSKTIIYGLLVLTVFWFLYRFVARMISKAMGPKTPETATLADFTQTDTVNYVPKPFSASNVDSDKTIDAILNGQFGPTVVMFYADWCTHCKNMTDAFESAAALSRVPFVRIQGQLAPVSSQKHGVTGYPTIFGISSIPGPAKRFAAMRTKEGLLEFASALSPQAFASVQPVASVQTVAHAVATSVPTATPSGAPVVATIPPSVTLSE